MCIYDYGNYVVMRIIIFFIQYSIKNCGWYQRKISWLRVNFIIIFYLWFDRRHSSEIPACVYLPGFRCAFRHKWERYIYVIRYTVWHSGHRKNYNLHPIQYNKYFLFTHNSPYILFLFFSFFHPTNLSLTLLNRVHDTSAPHFPVSFVILIFFFFFYLFFSVLVGRLLSLHHSRNDQRKSG